MIPNKREERKKHEMNAQETPGIESTEEPLFVLKYKRWKVWVQAAIHSFLPLLCCVSIFALAASPLSMSKFLAWLAFFLGLFFLGIFAIAAALSFKEIRLYNDRIVEVSKLLGKTTVELASARLQITYVPWCVGQIQIVHRDANRLLGAGPWRTVQYNIYLADRNKVRELHNLLAQISGRKVEEFDRTGITDMNPLIKEDATPCRNQTILRPPIK